MVDAIPLREWRERKEAAGRTLTDRPIDQSAEKPAGTFTMPLTRELYSPQFGKEGSKEVRDGGKECVPGLAHDFKHIRPPVRPSVRLGTTNGRGKCGTTSTVLHCISHIILL